MATASSAETTPPAGHGVAASERLLALDALRGFVMFWIIGADDIGHALAHLHAGPVMAFLARQLDHVAWEGCRFYDLIFPTFVFLIGVAITFSLGRLVEREGRAGAVRRIFRRALLLYALGLFYYGGIAGGPEMVRWVGVLQRLAFCYFFAGLAFIYLTPRGQVALCAGLLAGYWALLTFVPVPGIGAAGFAEGKNIVNWFDLHYLPGRKWDVTHDPEGVLSNFPAVASCLLGVFAGRWMQRRDVPETTRLTKLAVAGVIAIVAGHLWGLQFPVVKKLWTSSYVLVAGGWSALLLAGFYWVIEVRKLRGWAMPFVWIGSNALAIYILSNVIPFAKLSERFAGDGVKVFFDGLVPGLGQVVLAFVGMGLCVWVCWFLYRRKLFIRL